MRNASWLLLFMLFSCKTVQRSSSSQLRSTNTNVAPEICIGGSDRVADPVKAAFWSSLRISFFTNLGKEASDCGDLKSFLSGKLLRPDGKIPMIHLNLSGVGLKDSDLSTYLGDISADLPDCSKAEFVGLDLSNNQLESKLQIFESQVGSCGIFDKIVYLNIAHNNYSSDVSVLFDWLKKSAKTLQILDFSKNNFSGRIEKIDDYQSLIFLNAEGNNLTEFKVATSFPLAYLNFSNQRTGALAKISLVGNRGNSPADRLLNLTHLDMDGANIIGGGDGLSDSTGPHTLLFADAISMKRTLPPSGTRRQIRIDSTLLDVRGWGTDLSGTVRLTWNGTAWKPATFKKVYSDTCVADKSCVDVMPLGGCEYFGLMKSIASTLTEPGEISSFEAGLAPYRAVCQ